MATELDTLAVNLRTKLAAVSGLTALPENVSIEDVPDSDKTWFSVEPGVYDELAPEHGGGVYVGHIGEVAVKLAFEKDDDEEDFTDTRAQLLSGARAAVLKVSNWTSGILLVSPFLSSSSDDRTENRVDLIYRVRYRVAQDLT